MIRKLLPYIDGYKKESIITPIFIALEVILEIIIPVLMARIIDNGIKRYDMKYVLIVGSIMIVAAFLSLGCGVLAGKYAAKASAGFAKNLRKAMYHHIQNYSFLNIDKFSTAGLVTRLTTDVANIQNAYQVSLRMLARPPLMLITAMAMSFYINAKLSLVFVFAVIFVGTLLYLIMTKAHPHFKEVFQQYDELNASVQENLTGIRAVKAYVREEHEIKKFRKVSKDLYHNFIKAEKIIICNAPVMQFAMNTCILLLSWLGANMIVSNSMTTGELMSFFTYTTNILMSLMFLSMALLMIIIARSSALRVIEVLDEENDLKSPAHPIAKVQDGSIKFTNVSFSYVNDKDNVVLENINLDIKSGETIGIIGGTGSGKSTLVQLIPRLYDVTEGTIEVGGINVKEYDVEVLRNEVSMVLQKNVLFSGTVKENLRWGNKHASESELIEACKMAQADEFIQNMPNKYDSFVEQGGSNLSGGQKQRLCIARALLKKPKIIILDDSTSAVDTKTDAHIRKAFKEAIPNTTKIIIAQRVSSVQDSDKIIVLDDGKIDQIGTHEELLIDSTIYREIYESQVKGYEKNEAK